MRLRSKPIRASASLAAICGSLAICLHAGCASVDLWRSPLPMSADLTVEPVRAPATSPVKLVAAETPAETSAAADSPLATTPSESTSAKDKSTSKKETAAVVASFDIADAPPPPEALSFRQAIEFGLQNNPRLPAALAAIERARGEVDVAFSPFLPQIDYLSHAAITSPTLGPAAAGSTGIILSQGEGTHEYAQAELQIQWTVCDFGRTAGHYNETKARERIAELQSARVQQTVGFDVASAYLLSLRADAARRIQDEAIRQAEATLHDTRSRRAAGVAEKDDVLRAEVQLAAAKEDLDVARQVELSSHARLNNAMGRDASLPVTLLGWNSEPPYSLSLAQSLEIAAAQRAEIAIAREEVAGAQFGREAAKAEFLPRVYAVGSFGTVGGTNVQRGMQEGTGLHIDLPLYTGGRRHGELHVADADIHRAVAGARSILDGVTLEVTLAYLAATTARHRIELDRPAIVEADENLRLVRNRYRNGQATPTDIVDAEVALTRAQQRLVSATYEYLGALVGLDYALQNPPGSLLGLNEAPPAENLQTPQTQPANPPVPQKQ
jgi:outer membrane protein